MKTLIITNGKDDLKMKNVKKIVVVTLIVASTLCIGGLLDTSSNKLETEVAFATDPPLPR